MKATRRMTIVALLLTLVGSAKADWITVGNNMYADVSGNVGIGTNSPGAKLEVSDSKLITMLVGTGNANKGRISIRRFGAGISNSWESTVKIKPAHSNDRALTVLNYGESAAAILGDVGGASGWFWGGDVRVNSANLTVMGGNLGVGTMSPKSKLDIVGNSILLRPSTAADSKSISLFTSGAEVDLAADKADLFIKSNTGNTIIQAFGGNVGIGMNNPPQKLSVNGRIGLTNVPVWDGTDDNDLTWDGFAIGREGSSRRYKQNIHPFEEDFRMILKLEAKQYQMREGYGNPEKDLFGYIAEDVEEVGLTKLVTHDTEGRPDGIKYKKLAIYLNEIVKEHDQDIAKLKGEIGKRQGASSLPSIAESNGYVGIGTMGPAGRLDVNDSIYIEQLHKRITVLEEKLAKLEASMTTE